MRRGKNKNGMHEVISFRNTENELNLVHKKNGKNKNVIVVQDIQILPNVFNETNFSF